ncbi:MAG: polysaccharide biosynthesis tyrosine autokinase [Pirellulales bacterium]|nr:polysaccharide biosynthesis tyrosine autokinase [Pirellulales bacterium]
MVDSGDPSAFSKRVITVPSSRWQGPPPRTTSPANGASRPTMSFGFVLYAIRQWWKVALPVGLVLAGLAGTLRYVLFEPVYEASAVLHIDESPRYIVFEPEAKPSQRYVETQLELIRDRMVLGPVVGKPEIASLPEVREQISPIDWLQKEVQVEPVGRSNLYSISMRGPRAESVTRIVNAVMDIYLELRRQKDAERVETVLTALEEERKDHKERLEQLREDVRKLTIEATGEDPNVARPTPNDAGTPSLAADLENRLVTAEMEQRTMEMQIQLYKDMPSRDKPVVSASELDADPAIASRVAMLAEQQSQLALIEARSRQGKNDPAYRQLERVIAQGSQVLGAMRENLRTRLLAQREADAETQREAAITSMQRDLERYGIMQKLLKERYDAEIAKAKVVSGDTLDLEFRRAELERAGEMLNLIAQRCMGLHDTQKAPSQVSLMRAAEKPSAPLPINPYKEMLLLCLAGLCLPFALAVVWERSVRRVSNFQQLEQEAEMVIVGETPRLPVRTLSARNASSHGGGRDLEVFEESIDGLRTCLMLSEPLKNMRILAVTSAASQEGKTSIAAQLAVSVARATGGPTLLIDGDMRSPDIHNIFGIRQKPGLAEVLSGDCTAADAIVTSWSQHVHLLPGGRLTASPHKLLGMGRLEALLEEVRPSYSCIVIDTPPVLSASEAIVLAKAAEATLMCVMQDSSRIDQVRKAYERLAAAGTRPFGTVLNGVPTKRYAYRYGSYAYTRS